MMTVGEKRGETCRDTLYCWGAEIPALGGEGTSAIATEMTHDEFLSWQQTKTSPASLNNDLRKLQISQNEAPVVSTGRAQEKRTLFTSSARCPCDHPDTGSRTLLGPPRGAQELMDSNRSKQICWGPGKVVEREALGICSN